MGHTTEKYPTPESPRDWPLVSELILLDTAVTRRGWLKTDQVTTSSIFYTHCGIRMQIIYTTFIHCSHFYNNQGPFRRTVSKMCTASPTLVPRIGPCPHWVQKPSFLRLFFKLDFFAGSLVYLFSIWWCFFFWLNVNTTSALMTCRSQHCDFVHVLGSDYPVLQLQELALGKIDFAALRIIWPTKLKSGNNNSRTAIRNMTHIRSFGRKITHLKRVSQDLCSLRKLWALVFSSSKLRRITEISTLLSMIRLGKNHRRFYKRWDCQIEKFETPHFSQSGLLLCY